MGARTTGKGFTLIELAIVLVIMGIVGTLFYRVMFSWVAKEKTNEAARIVATVDKVLEGAMLGDDAGALPAAETNPSPQDAEDGDLLPASLGMATDPWGNRLRYFSADVDVSTALKTDVYVRVYNNAANFALDHGSAPNAAGGGLPASPTGQAHADQLISNVAYVVLSLGPDGRKQYRQVEGSTYIDVLKPGLDAAHSGTGDATQSFDDQFSYKTLDALKSRYQSVKSIGVSSTSSPPAGAAYSSSSLEDGEAGSGTLVNAAVAEDSSVPDGKVLDLTASSSDYVDLSSTAVGTATYTEYTILGWFKTSGTPQSGDFDVITARMNPGVSGQRTWWVVLWHATQYLTQGDLTKKPGELGFKGATSQTQSGDNDFIVDTQCQSNGGAPCHYDGHWHFFCLRVKNNADISATRYEATLFVNYTPGGDLVRMPRSEADRDAAGDPKNELIDPLGWTISDSAPLNAASYKTYIGQEPGSTSRNFQGYLDEITIYESALTDDAITSYYNANKAYYQ